MAHKLTSHAVRPLLCQVKQIPKGILGLHGDTLLLSRAKALGAVGSHGRCAYILKACKYTRYVEFIYIYIRIYVYIYTHFYISYIYTFLYIMYIYICIYVYKYSQVGR